MPPERRVLPERLVLRVCPATRRSQRRFTAQADLASPPKRFAPHHRPDCRGETEVAAAADCWARYDHDRRAYAKPVTSPLPKQRGRVARHQRNAATVSCGLTAPLGAYSGQGRMTPDSNRGWHGVEPVDDRYGCRWCRDTVFCSFRSDGDAVASVDLRDFVLGRAGHGVSAACGEPHLTRRNL